MQVHLLAPSDMELPSSTPPAVDVAKKCVVITPNSKYKSTSPIITGYVRVQGDSGAMRKFVLLVNPSDGAVTVAEEVSSPAAFDKLTADEAAKKVNPPKRDRTKKPAAPAAAT